MQVRSRVDDLMEVSILWFVWQTKWLWNIIIRPTHTQLLKCCRGHFTAMHWGFKRLTRPSLSSVSPSPSGLKLCKPSWFVFGRFLPYCRSNVAPIRCTFLQLCAEVCGSVDGSIVVVEGLRATSLSSIDCSVMACMWDLRFIYYQCFHLGENPWFIVSSFL